MDNLQTQMMINLVIMFFMGFSVWLFFLRNFLVNWIKVKTPFTKYNVLVEVQHPVQNYYASGQIEKNFLYYKGKKTRDNPKAQRIVDLTEIEKELGIYNVVHRGWGVPCIRVDDAKACVLFRDEDSYKSITGYSAEAIDDLVTDAQNRPSLDEGLIHPKVFQIIVIIALFIIALGLYMVYDTVMKQTVMVDGHVKLVYDYLVANYNVTASVAPSVPINTGIGG